MPKEAGLLIPIWSVMRHSAREHEAALPSGHGRIGHEMIGKAQVLQFVKWLWGSFLLLLSLPIVSIFIFLAAFVVPEVID